MININKPIQFTEGERGRYVLDINWSPDECCDRPVLLYADSDREILPGVFFSVKAPSLSKETAFSTKDNYAVLSEDDRNISIIVRYDRTKTGWSENTTQSFQLILESTCEGDNVNNTIINGEIEYLVEYNCRLTIQKHVEGPASNNPLGVVVGKINGGVPPYIVKLEKNNGLNSEEWLPAPGAPVLTLQSASEEFTFNNLEAGFYRLNIEDRRGFPVPKPCTVQLKAISDLNFNIDSLPKNTPCFDDKRYQISKNGGEDGFVRFNLLSNSKPIDIYWQGPFESEPSLSETNYYTESSPNLSNNIVKRTQAGNGNGVGDLINVRAGWYGIAVIDAYKNVGVDTIQLREPKKTKLSIDEEATSAPCRNGADNGNIALVIEGDPLRNNENDYEIIWSYNNTAINLENTSVLDPRFSWADRGCEPLQMLDISGIIPGPERKYDEITDTTRLTYKGMRSGTYEVRVRDCTGDIIGPISITLRDPAPIKVSVSDPIHACSCQAPDNLGAIRVTLESGRYPFTITLEGEQTPPIEIEVTENEDTNDETLPFTKFIDDIPSDFWTLKITENTAPEEPEECRAESDEFEFVIKKPDTINFVVNEDETMIPSCSDTSDGRISIERANDCPVYDERLVIKNEPKIEWFANGNKLTTGISETRNEFGKLKSTISNISGSLVYQYKITYNKVNDACGDISPIVDTVSLDAPEELTLNLDVSNVSINGASDGVLSVDVSNGFPPYEIKWSGPNGFSEIGTDLFTVENLSPGSYNVIVTDSNGCSKSDSATIEQPPVLNAILDEATTVGGVTTNLEIPFACESGNLVIAVTNETFFSGQELAPFSVQLMKGDMMLSQQTTPENIASGIYYFVFEGATASNSSDLVLDEGEYKVIVTDSLDQVVEIYTEITIDSSLDNPCKDSSNFSILSVTGGSLNEPLSILRDLDGNSIIEIAEDFVGFMEFKIKRLIKSSFDTDICLPFDHVCCKSFYVELPKSSNLEFDASGLVSNTNSITNYQNGAPNLPNIMEIIEVDGANRKLLIKDDCLNIRDVQDISNPYDTGSVIRLKVKTIDGENLAQTGLNESFDAELQYVEHEIDTNFDIITNSNIDEPNFIFESSLKYNLSCAACVDENNATTDCECN